MEMELEEQTPAYRGFLRSGQYPALTRRLRRSGELAGRAASLIALAALAAGTGYKLTQRVVSPAAPSSAAVEQQPAARPAGRPLGAVHAPQPIAAEPVASQPVTSVEPAQPRRVPSRPSATSTRKKSSEPSAAASPVEAAIVEPPAHEARATDEEALTERIAERVRALDEAPAAVSVRAPEPAVRHEPPPATATKPAQPAEAPSLPLRAAASLVDLDVRGSLSSASVRHGVERVRPALAGCYAQAAQRAGHNGFGRVQLRFTIDETGRARAPKVDETALPGLSECLRTAIGKLVCQAPDTGTVQAQLALDFAP